MDLKKELYRQIRHLKIRQQVHREEAKEEDNDYGKYMKGFNLGRSAEIELTIMYLREIADKAERYS